MLRMAHAIKTLYIEPHGPLGVFFSYTEKDEEYFINFSLK